MDSPRGWATDCRVWLTFRPLYIDPTVWRAYYPTETVLGGELAVPWNRNPLQRAESLPKGVTAVSVTVVRC